VLDDLRCEVRRIEKVLTDLLAYARPKPPQLAGGLDRADDARPPDCSATDG